MFRYSPGIRTKLIAIFILIKVVPLVALAWFAWDEIFKLGNTLEQKYLAMISSTGETVGRVTEQSTADAIRALDQKSREAIERLTTDTARTVAAFLYDRDRDIELAAQVPPDEETFRRFLAARHRPVILHGEWIMDPAGQKWVPDLAFDPGSNRMVSANNDDNRRDFNYRAPDNQGIVKDRPTYLEMTFVGPDGREKIKVTTSDILPARLNDVSDPQNTYCRAEGYFQALKRLKQGEIYVSPVIGPYVKGHIVGTYSRVQAREMGIPFDPASSGYAGKENPVGVRFQGLVRWATPVVRNGDIIGYVTLALDHTHLMEFTDHVIPTEARYSAISDAASGNYAFMWDYLGRNISHPRDYFIVGYDPATGEQAVPWLDEEMYDIWQRSNGSMTTFQELAPTFKDQRLDKKPSRTLVEAGMLGLDGRYLNFAPQCSGWHNLTQYGGSGSFLIFWSGLWKLTTAAAIPYYTGIYGQHPRGFGYVTIGANVDEFHRPAIESAAAIKVIESRFNESLDMEKQANKALIGVTLRKAFKNLTFYTGLMVVLVIGIAVFMAAALTRRITHIVSGMRRFQEGDRGHRLIPASRDETGQLAETFNEMADTVQHYIGDIEASNQQIEQVNVRLTREIEERRQAQIELSRHRDNLEELVAARTQALENEIVERKRVEELQARSEKRLRRHNNCLLRLAGDNRLHTGELTNALQVIMQAAAVTLKVERSSVWLHDAKRGATRCAEMYILSTGEHSAGEDLPAGKYSILVKAMRAFRSIAASDVFTDERLAEVPESYYRVLDIHSLLIAAILSDGVMVGTVSFEHVKTKRQWHIDEQNFANSIADMVALAIEAAKRKGEAKEKEQLEIRLRRAEKMEAIGTLAGGVAHDLNNILSGIVSYPELLLHQMPADSTLRKPVETILNSGKRAATIVQDLLTLSRRGVEAMEVVNLNDVVGEYLKSPEHQKIMSFYPDIDVQTQLGAELMNISGSTAHLAKTLMNLVINAAEAIDDRGVIRIATGNCYIDRPIKRYDMVNEGDYAALTVTDTGGGISPEDMNHIFEPFYTKKKMGRSGTGLGMAVVWGVVKDHRGYIDFESRPEEGSRFTLYFPVTRQPIATVRSRAMDEYRGRGETILVVDDVQEQREIASAILSELGYNINAVPSGEAAVDYLHEHSVDLLVLDMIMDPGMDGLDTYRAILRRHPRQKAIIASGFSETERIREVQRLGAVQYIKKPYTIERIGLAVRRALGDAIR